MLTSVECRRRAEQKIAEAERHPRRDRSSAPRNRKFRRTGLRGPSMVTAADNRCPKSQPPCLALVFNAPTRAVLSKNTRNSPTL
jgi:hypothetical protein